MPVTTSLNKMLDVLPAGERSKLFLFKDNMPGQPIAMNEVIDKAGLMFAAHVMPSLDVRHKKDIRYFAHDCLQIINDIHFRAHKDTEVHIRTDLRYDTRQDQFSRGMAALALFNEGFMTEEDFIDRAITVEAQVPHEKHPAYHPMMALGYALQMDIQNNVVDMCHHVLEVPANKLGQRMFYGLMTLAMKNRFK